jgi:hypothetical protein
LSIEARSAEWILDARLGKHLFHLMDAPARAWQPVAKTRQF